MDFLESKRVYFRASNWHQASIGSDNDLAPETRQVIIWSNTCLIHWPRHSAKLRTVDISKKKPRRATTLSVYLMVAMLVTVTSTWWLLDAWSLFVNKSSAAIMLTYQFMQRSALWPQRILMVISANHHPLTVIFYFFKCHLCCTNVTYYAYHAS